MAMLEEEGECVSLGEARLILVTVSYALSLCPDTAIEASNCRQVTVIITGPSAKGGGQIQTTLQAGYRDHYHCVGLLEQLKHVVKLVS